MGKEKDILDKVLSKPSESDEIRRMVAGQEEVFPSISDITLDEPYSDPFAVPKWCNTINFAFAWIDPKDDIQRHRAMDVGYFRFVTRMSSCIVGKPTERDFRDHGAVERQGMLLVFRPKDIDDRLRTRPVLAHKDMVASLEAGKKAVGYEITHSKGREAEDSKVTVVAYEEAGEVGIKQA